MTVTRRRVQVPQVVGFGPPGERTWWADRGAGGGGVGYVGLRQFTTGTADRLIDKVAELRDAGAAGVILDLRGNPGGSLGEARAMLEAFLPAGAPLYETRGANVPTRRERAAEPARFGGLPLAVLIDEASASASEVLAGALQANGRAVVVGRRSFGKGSVQQTLPVRSSDGTLKLTVASYHLPTGRPVQRTPDSKVWGVEPDVEVDPPATRPADDRDAAVRRAVGVLAGS